MNKVDLHRLIEKLPDSQIPTVGTFLGYVLEQHSGSSDPHDSAPYDDEEFSEEELTSFEEAHQEYQRGETFTLEEIKRKYNVG